MWYSVSNRRNRQGQSLDRGTDNLYDRIYVIRSELSLMLSFITHIVPHVKVDTELELPFTIKCHNEIE